MRTMVSVSDVLKAIAEEPEYPGDMPDEVWNKIGNDRKMVEKALRSTVQITKNRIRQRIELMAIGD